MSKDGQVNQRKEGEAPHVEVSSKVGARSYDRGQAIMGGRNEGAVYGKVGKEEHRRVR